MIGFRDALTLAGAKLHSKRIMLGISIVVSGLLFGVLCAASIVVTGLSASAHNYTRAALGGQYLVHSVPNIPQAVAGAAPENLSKDTVDELNKLQADYIARQKALGKKLHITVDAASVAPILLPDPFADSSLPAERRVRINFESPVYSDYLRRVQTDYIKVAKNTTSDLKAAAGPYGAKAYYQNQPAQVSFTGMQYLVGGKEDLSKFSVNVKPQNSDLTAYGYMTYGVRNSDYTMIDDAIIKRFILPANDKRSADVSSIPVVITVPEAVALFGKQLGIGEKPKAAADQIVWMGSLQQKINGVTYTACYRNQTELLELQKIAQDAAEADDHKNDPTYVKPALAYNLPAGTCGDITIRQDKRTADEKQAERDQIALSKAEGTYEAPQHQLFTFIIAGVMPLSPANQAPTNLPDFMSSLLGAQYNAGAIIPSQEYKALASSARHEDILFSHPKLGALDTLAQGGIVEMIVAFPSAQSARSFIADRACPMYDTSCTRPFMAEPYGSNYLLVDDIDATATKTLKTALPIALGIAGIIIWATMARVIIDSRRETAVFRAIGAKRRDIMATYLLYSMIVALRIVGFSLLLGAGLAAAIQSVYGQQAADFAKVTYGVFDKIQAFSFIGFNVAQILLLVVCIIGISLMAVLPPLLRNVRRSPISDMRDE